MEFVRFFTEAPFIVWKYICERTFPLLLKADPHCRDAHAHACDRHSSLFLNRRDHTEDHAQGRGYSYLKTVMNICNVHELSVSAPIVLISLYKICLRSSYCLIVT